MKKTIVCIFGCWDLLHVGHLTILERAKTFGDILVVGVFTDSLIASKEYKDRPPIISCEDRCRMLQALICVDLTVILEEREYLPILKKFDVDVLVVGEDWGSSRGNIESFEYMKLNNKRFIQLPYTERVSSTKIKQQIINSYSL